MHATFNHGQQAIPLKGRSAGSPRQLPANPFWAAGQSATIAAAPLIHPQRPSPQRCQIWLQGCPWTAWACPAASRQSRQTCNERRTHSQTLQALASELAIVIWGVLLQNTRLAKHVT